MVEFGKTSMLLFRLYICRLLLVDQIGHFYALAQFDRMVSY
jgi:hypothetical protein